MGKITGFMEIKRETPSRRPVGERLKDWREFDLKMPEDKLRAQGARCMDCGIPFCHKGCPLGNIIPDWNDLIYRGRWREAIDRLHSTNNFPEFTGRICPGAVRRSLRPQHQQRSRHDQADREEHHRSCVGGRMDRAAARPRKTGKRVAVVGSGPAGLACAQQLARAGHAVTLYERSDRVGGLLMYGIPDFKLEKWHVNRRVEQMKAEGVEIRDQLPRRHRSSRRRDAREARRDRADDRRDQAARPADPRPRSQGHTFRDGISAATEQAQLRRRDRSAAEIHRAKESASSSSAAAIPAPTASAPRIARAR